MSVSNFKIKGLSDHEVEISRKYHGTNTLNFKNNNGLLNALKRLLTEPMVILLFIASFIYFISGNYSDGIFMFFAIILISIISLYQEERSKNALENLKNYSQPKCKVIRNGKVIHIKSEDIVLGDSLIVEEGSTIAADGQIVHSNDFSVNESILTGESLAVYKDAFNEDNFIYRGTIVESGLAIATITAIGNTTEIGKIGKSLESIKEETTPLEMQISNFVKKMAIAGTLIFILIWILSYFKTQSLINSLLAALTIAMSILPEEIPVAFTTFMAIGAWRLMKVGIVVKQMKTVETLGSATVICVDKTGTITQNKMSFTKLYALNSNRITSPNNSLNLEEKELIKLAMWASEPIPFDSMEIELHNAYKNSILIDERPHYKIIHEYPLGGVPPMMTHIFENNEGSRIIAAKGAPEALLKISTLNEDEINNITSIFNELATNGFRVLGVAEANFKGPNFPKTQQEFKFNFKGLVAFHDPPKENIQSVLKKFDAAGIDVKIVTGDTLATTAAIAEQIGFKGIDKSISGDELMNLNDVELQEKVFKSKIFTRMFPDAKLKIIDALKAKNQVVAMTGDGVNDGPALKAAHIGIAMGKKGTEIAKDAASLILLEDDLSKMIDAIALGRKIYTNLKKAIQYIISIHIPIILTVFIPLVLGWIYPYIFTPIHVIFLELIMGPTCSIIYENEPIEKNAMLKKPRPFSITFFNWNELLISIIQGLIITAGTLIAYQFSIQQGYNETLTRSMVFTTLIAANIFLTLVNRSFYYSIFKIIQFKNHLVWLIISITILISILILYVPLFAIFFKIEPLSSSQLFISISIGFLSVFWFEVFKWIKRIRSK